MPLDTEEMIRLLLKTNEEKDKTIETLQATIKDLQATISNLNETLDELKRKLFGTSSEKISGRSGNGCALPRPKS